MTRTFIRLALFVAMFVTGATAYAQFTLVKSVVGNGGGPSTNGSFSLNGTIGQAVIGLVSNTSFTHGIGFWYPTDQTTGVEDATPGYAAGGNVLFQNFPNPFRAATTIRFSLAQRANVTLKVFNMPGQVVATLADGNYESGEHDVELSQALPSGTYFYQLQVGTSVLRRQMVVAR